jgi:hypothetical protein
VFEAFVLQGLGIAPQLSRQSERTNVSKIDLTDTSETRISIPEDAEAFAKPFRGQRLVTKLRRSHGPAAEANAASAAGGYRARREHGDSLTDIARTFGVAQTTIARLTG